MKRFGMNCELKQFLQNFEKKIGEIVGKWLQVLKNICEILWFH